MFKFIYIFLDLLGFQIPDKYWKPNVFRGNELDRFIDTDVRNSAKLSLKDINELNHYFGFALVRNPYDRLVSCYSEKIRYDCPDGLFVNGISTTLTKYNAFYRGMSFEKFVNKISNINDIWADFYIRSQSSMLYSYSGKRLVNYIGYFENISKELDAISTKIGVTRDVPHLLKSSRDKWESYYTKELKEIVYQRYRNDFRLLSYSKN